jgi:hypothetical protein
MDSSISRFGDYPLVLIACTTTSITETQNPKMTICTFLLSEPFIQEPTVTWQLFMVISNTESSQVHL